MASDDELKKAAEAVRAAVEAYNLAVFDAAKVGLEVAVAISPAANMEGIRVPHLDVTAITKTDVF